MSTSRRSGLTAVALDKARRRVQRGDALQQPQRGGAQRRVAALARADRGAPACCGLPRCSGGEAGVQLVVGGKVQQALLRGERRRPAWARPLGDLRDKRRGCVEGELDVL